MSLRKVLKNIIDIVSKNPVETLLFLTAIILRLYRFEEFVTFLGDQGRDAIIVKRILTLEHLPSIGAPTSIGQIYLGPFYYYFIAPFLLLFRFHPIGLAYGVAFFSIVGLVVSYFIVRRFFGATVSRVFLILLTFSYVNIEFSRFSWNPNLLPLFSFLTLYFFHEFLKTKHTKWAILLGAFLSFSIQLHYLAGFLVFPMVILFITSYSKNVNQRVMLIKKIIPSLMSFFIFSSPLLVFDLRHQFLNTKNFIKLFIGKELTTSAPYLNRLIEVNRSFFSHFFQIELNPIVGLLFFVVFLLGFFYMYKDLRRSPFLLLNYLNIVFFVVLFSFLNSPRYPHYFGTIYYSFFVLLAFYLVNLKPRLRALIGTFIILIIYLFFNFQKFYYFKNPSNNQIQSAEQIALSIVPNITQLPYQLVSLPSTETGAHVRYFLELNNKTPLPEDSPIQPPELFVLCFTQQCPVIGNPQWQIASFQNAKIVKTWASEGITIYKLIHEQ